MPGLEVFKRLVNATGHTLLVGFGIAVMVVALFLAVVAIYRACCDAPPIAMTPIGDSLVDRPVCPGEEHDVASIVTVTKPTLLYLYISVMDEKSDYNIPETQLSFVPRPHPHAASFTQHLSWIVPELDTGSYTRVVTVRGHDTDESPVFYIVPFRIRPDCRNYPSKRVPP